MPTQTIQIPGVITVGELATKTGIPVTKLIAELMKNGIMATINEQIDFDTAQIIVDELGLDIALAQETAAEAKSTKRERSVSDKAQPRPPVVAVMGHVDHGKTTLLDAIRGAKVAPGEAGGITQHISAYQVTYKNRLITFLDTPGHEAFSALREHGAQLTDVAVIVVAADDGVKPQTKEAVQFATSAGVKVVVAINKMDKADANPNRVKQQLSDLGLVPEDWGGDTVMVEISAKEKTGIDQLLDMVLLVTDVEELKADADVPAEGMVIESHMEHGRGALATLLIEQGELAPGRFIVAGPVYGKVRTLEDYAGKPIKQAGPSTPVRVTGFRDLPDFGVTFRAVSNEKEAKAAAFENARSAGAQHEARVSTSHDLLSMIDAHRASKTAPIVVKADVQGSLTSVIESLKSLENEEIKIRVIASGVGAVSESDVTHAAASDALVYGFNVDVPIGVKRLAARENVRVRTFKVIYELIDDAKAVLSQLLEPEIVEEAVGVLTIKGVFRTTKNEIIAGGEVIEGVAQPDTLVRLKRGEELLGEAEVKSVQKQQQAVKEVRTGELCGLQLATSAKIVLQEGDRIEFFRRKTVERTL